MEGPSLTPDSSRSQAILSSVCPLRTFLVDSSSSASCLWFFVISQTFVNLEQESDL